MKKRKFKISPTLNKSSGFFLMQKYIFIKIDSFQLILLICKLKIKSKGTFSYKVPIEDYCSKIPDLAKTTSQSSNKYSTVCKNNEKILF